MTKTTKKKATPAAAPKSIPKAGMSRSAKYIHDYLKKYLCVDKISNLEANDIDISELCDERAEMIIDALPEDLKPRYEAGARIHALYEIAYMACSCSGIGDVQKVKTDIEAIYQSVVDCGNEYASSSRKRTTHHLDMMDMFLFCFLETFPLKELKTILPNSDTNENEDDESENQKKIRDSAAINIYVQKESFAKRYYHPTYINTVEVDIRRGGKKQYKRDPRDFRYVPPTYEFLEKYGIKALIVMNDDVAEPISSKYEIKALGDDDHELIKQLLKSEAISPEQKKAIRRALRLMDKYRERYENLHETLVRIRSMTTEASKT